MSEESPRPTDGVYETTFDWSEKDPSNAVVDTVSAVRNREVEKLGPLYNSVDPDALDTLVQSANSASGAESVVISFNFDGVAVSVHGSGKLCVELPAYE